MKRESSWKKIKVCTSCNKILSDSVIYYNNGLCSYCGIESVGTICNTKSIIYKKIKYYSWWQLFNRKIEYIGKNKESEDWILNND